MWLQYRFLKVLLSKETNDHITVGMVSWDGTEFRSAMSFDSLPYNLDEREEICRRAVDLIEKAPGFQAKAPNKCLYQISDSRATHRLVWSPVCTYPLTSDETTTAVFSTLVRAARLGAGRKR